MFRVIAVLAISSLSFAQTASDLEAPAVNRVADKLLCSCGCKDKMTCRMEPYMCGVCKTNKTRIFKLQQAGMSDQAIIDTFVKENGADVLAVPTTVVEVVRRRSDRRRRKAH